MLITGWLMAGILWSQPVASLTGQEARFVVETVAADLDSPWAVDFLPDGSPVVSLKKGGLVLVRNGVRVEVGGMPEMQSSGQGGLLDVLIPEEFSRSGRIYLSFSGGGSGEQQTSVARARIVEWRGSTPRLEEWEPIFSGTNVAEGGHHFGSRLVLTSEGYLFVTIGERNRRHQAQDPGNHFGTVVRLHADGRVPQDNPFQPGQPMAGMGAPEVYTWGHRNPQGAARHPVTGDIWIHEHGPRGGDEINILKPGVNYGWPVITYGREYYGAAVGDGLTAKEGMAQPLLHWTPSIAPSGMAFYRSRVFPEWDGDLFVGALAGRHLRRIDLGGDKGDQVMGQEVLLKESLGRIRDVAQGPEGYLYLLTDGKRGGLYCLKPES